ncbi:MAG: DUF3108 domain-containing protein [Bacteroidia bacterium]|nr:DUF3108 domain-containing protein [Bacteroidia bacterium]
MKNICLIVCTLCSLYVQAQINITTKPNTTFRAGEVLNYRVHYGFIDAGEAKIEVLPEIKKLGNRPCYHVVGTGRSLGAFDLFFKVRDRYESFIDSLGLVPWLFIRRVDEGGYKINQTVSFNHYNKIATSQKSTLNMPEQLQDLISAFYYARNENFASMAPGKIIEMKAWLDEEIIPLNLKFIGRETIQTKFGKIKCIVLRPGLLEGRVFKSNEDMTLWISDDENKIPIRAQANILVGSIKMDLKSYSGLKAPLQKAH